MSKNKENKENKNEIERHYTKQYNNMKFKIGGGAHWPLTPYSASSTMYYYFGVLTPTSNFYRYA